MGGIFNGVKIGVTPDKEEVSWENEKKWREKASEDLEQAERKQTIPISLIYKIYDDLDGYGYDHKENISDTIEDLKYYSNTKGLQDTLERYLVASGHRKNQKLFKKKDIGEDIEDTLSKTLDNLSPSAQNVVEKAMEWLKDTDNDSERASILSGLLDDVLFNYEDEDKIKRLIDKL